MTRRTSLLLAITTLLLLPTAADAEENKKKRVEFFARKLRVILRNGSQVVGIIRTRKLFERERSGLFEPVDLQKLREAHEAAKDAALRAGKPLPPDPTSEVGMRLWFVMGNEGYVFLQKKDIKSWKLEESIAEQEFKKIKLQAEARAAKRRAAAARRAAREEAKRKKAEQAKPGDEKQGEDKAAKKDGEELKVPEGFEDEEEWIKRAKELLEKFPPKDGWGKDKKSYDWLKYKYQRTKAHTKVRTIVVNGKKRTVRTKRGIPRTKLEDEFYDNYALWTEAVKWQKAGKLDPAKETGKPKGPPGVKVPQPEKGPRQPSDQPK